MAQKWHAIARVRASIQEASGLLAESRKRQWYSPFSHSRTECSWWIHHPFILMWYWETTGGPYKAASATQIAAQRWSMSHGNARHALFMSSLYSGSVTFYSGHPARHIRSGSQRRLKILLLRLWLPFFPVVLSSWSSGETMPSVFSQVLMFWVLSSCLSGKIPWMYIKIKHFGPLEVIWPCVGLRLLTSQAWQKLPEGRMLIKCLWMKHYNYHVSCWIW